MTEQANEQVGTRSVTSRVELDATPEEVWELIATGEGMSNWFPIDAKVTPGVGGEIWFSWGPDVMEGTAQIVEWEPQKKLVGTWGSMRDEYLLVGEGGKTVMTVVSHGFGEGESWDDMLDSVKTGWMFELGGLKHYLANHKGKQRKVARAVLRVSGGEREAISSQLLDNGIAPGIDLRGVSVGNTCTISLDGLGEFEARVVVANQPRDLALVVPGLGDAYMRVLIEAPCGGSDEPAMDVTLWVSLYGADKSRGDEVEAALARVGSRLATGSKHVL